MMRAIQCLVLGLLSLGLVACGQGTPKTGALAGRVDKTLSLPGQSVETNQATEAETDKSNAETASARQYVPKPLVRNDATNPYLPPYEDQPPKLTSVSHLRQSIVAAETKAATLTPAPNVALAANQISMQAARTTTTLTTSKAALAPVNNPAVPALTKVAAATQTQVPLPASASSATVTPSLPSASQGTTAAVTSAPTISSVMPASAPEVNNPVKSEAVTPATSPQTSLPPTTTNTPLGSTSTTPNTAEAKQATNNAVNAPLLQTMPAATAPVEKTIPLPTSAQATPVPATLPNNQPNSQNQQSTGLYNSSNNIPDNSPPPTKPKRVQPQSFDEVPVPVLK